MTPPRSGLRPLPPQGGHAGGPAEPVPRRVLGRAGLLFAGIALVGGNAGAALRSEVLDDFRQPSAWQASASDQVKAALRRDRDGSLCLDYDFAGVSGYAVMRRKLPMQWPARFDLHARLKADGGGNDFQFKLADTSGDNVWWLNRPDAVLPLALADWRIRSRQIDFAWGPASERRLRETRFVEFVVAAGRRGGKGSLCVARLVLAERAPDPTTWPVPREKATRGGLDVDFGLAREFNGVALRWPAGARGLDYDLQASNDGRAWRTLRRVRGSDGGLDALFVPEGEARHLRVALKPGSRAARPQLTLKSATEWPTINAVIATLAADAPRGDLPRAFVGEQNYWTLVGVDGGGERSALLSEDGALEIGRGGFSIEPAVLLEDGRHVTWAGVAMTQRLRDGALPIPSVQWQHEAFGLQIEAAADGPRGAPVLLARYTLHNPTTRPQRLALLLALRPWQVNPAQQFLSTPGGVSVVRGLRWDGAALAADGRAPLRFTQPPQRASGAAFDGGLALAALQAAPPLSVLGDPQGLASALLAFDLTLAPGATHTVGLAAPLGTLDGGAMGLAPLQARIDAAADAWRARLGRVTLRGPAEVQRIADSLRSALAQILMSREGAALRPGTRSYARSWVRDGAMMVAGLVRLGELEAAREFVDWYGGQVFASGKVPCCVDQRGADPVVENDSHGQYLFAVAEVLRHGGGRAFAQRHWPQVQRVVAWMEALRQSERTAANRGPDRAHLFGLLPPSISHEGYADKPAYSYWDDFWALRGYKDVVLIAQTMGDEPRSTQLDVQSAAKSDVQSAAKLAVQWAGWRDEFERELAASITATAAHHRIGFIAGAADRGDFDATSTTVALNPAQAAVPEPLLRATFERYWEEMSARSEGRRTWNDYTPYELRTVGALVRLGWPERAHAMLGFFFKHQRPAGWNHWSEVVLHDPREPRFLGDMPHAWVSSDYIRSALDLFAYEREVDDALVIGAGLRSAWLDQSEIELRGLSTPYGRLDWKLARTASGWQLDVPLALKGLRRGVVLAWPQDRALPRARFEGRTLPWEGRELSLPAPPSSIELLIE